MRARVVVLLAIVLLPIVAVATPARAGGGGGGGPCGVLSRGTQLTVRDFCFDGIADVVPAGARITVTNDGQTTHNLVSVDGGFSSGNLNPGESAQLTVDRPGVYAYYCSFHGSAEGRGMAGVLVVEDGASLAATRLHGAVPAPT